MTYEYGDAPCCDGCCERRMVTCELCGQCDELDPMDICTCCSPNGDPLDYFGDK